MKYYIYWSILDSPSNSIKPYFIFLIMLVISIIAFLFLLKLKNSTDKKLYLIITSLFILLSFFGFIYLKFSIEDTTEKRLLKTLNSNRMKKVEGEISDYERQVAYPRSGNTTYETFNVDSVNFRYSDNAMYQFHHFGGNHTKTFHNGLKVKITYVKSEKLNEIQKIEIAK